jgi:tRNA threonylcarbamoyladenosine biosynthesis protein TsaB
MIVAVDTSTELTSVAVTVGGEVLAQRTELDARRHAEVLAPMLRQVLAESGAGPGDVTAIACGVGPGPYTGLRVGLATARAVGMAWDRPVVGLCSLDAMAGAAFADTDLDVVGVASDARRREVYWAAYARGRWRTRGPLVSKAASIDGELRAGAWTGHGAELYADDFGRVVAAVSQGMRYPLAGWIGRLTGELIADGMAVSAAHLQLDGQGDDGRETASALQGARLLPPVPLYLRRPDAAELPVRSTP